jgi:hypothetical protein
MMASNPYGACSGCGNTINRTLVYKSTNDNVRICVSNYLKNGLRQPRQDCLELYFRKVRKNVTQR